MHGPPARPTPDHRTTAPPHHRTTAAKEETMPLANLEQTSDVKAGTR
ncbi:hypothetical protein [Streptomyces sp. NPDC005374]